MPLWSFLSSVFCISSSLPLLLQQPPHSTTMFPYVCKDLLTFHVLWCFRHCLFHLLSVFIYVQVFALFFHCLISNHAFVFLSCLFLLELPYTYSWLKLLMPSSCCIKPMSVTNTLFFGTHSSFRDLNIMNHGFILLPYNNIVNCTFGTYVTSLDSCFVNCIADD